MKLEEFNRMSWNYIGKKEYANQTMSKYDCNVPNLSCYRIKHRASGRERVIYSYRGTMYRKAGDVVEAINKGRIFNPATKIARMV